MDDMSNELQAAWDAAVANCLNGHANCSYGGMTPSTGYWLRDDACDQPHGDHCAWCRTEATTGFVGWTTSGQEVYQVPACQPCADQWVAEHPEWKRDDPSEETARPSLDALIADANAARASFLASLPEEVRDAYLAADRAAENMLLWGNADGPAPGEKMSFTGIESIFGLDQAPKLVAPYPTKPQPPGPAKQRYNPTTKRWEAALDV